MKSALYLTAALAVATGASAGVHRCVFIRLQQV